MSDKHWPHSSRIAHRRTSMHDTMLCMSSADGLRQIWSPDDSLVVRQPCSIACPELYITLTKSCTSFANSPDKSAHYHKQEHKVTKSSTRVHITASAAGLDSPPAYNIDRSLMLSLIQVSYKNQIVLN